MISMNKSRLFVIVIQFLIFYSNAMSILDEIQNVPPKVKYGVNRRAFEKTLDNFKTNFDDDDDSPTWEESGLFEGDIMFYGNKRNALLDIKSRWENATIPFYIETSHFNETQIETILSAIKEFHDKTCLRFKPYEESDDHWVYVTGNERGCWSAVGRKSNGGQQLNLSPPKCVRRGVVIHEFLHAAGFLHQHSVSDRDEFIEIIWDNIAEKHKSNFNKYNDSVATSYGITYDYQSIMHYHRRAFSKNGNLTVIPLKNGTKIGQRIRFSESDIIKLNEMYKDSCNAVEIDTENEVKDTPGVFQWFLGLFG